MPDKKKHKVNSKKCNLYSQRMKALYTLKRSLKNYDDRFEVLSPVMSKIFRQWYANIAGEFIQRRLQRYRGEKINPDQILYDIIRGIVYGPDSRALLKVIERTLPKKKEVKKQTRRPF